MRCLGTSSLHELALGTGLALAAAAALAACADPPLDCVTTIDLSCQPLYPPTFDNVFTNTLVPKCSTGGGSCHTPEGHQAGLSFDKTNPDDAYRQLLLASTVFPQRERIAPGDPSCSVVVERIYSTADRWHMPRGSTLAATETCAIDRWVAEGALRGPVDAAPAADAAPHDAGVDAP